MVRSLLPDTEETTKDSADMEIGDAEDDFYASQELHAEGRGRDSSCGDFTDSDSEDSSDPDDGFKSRQWPPELLHSSQSFRKQHRCLRDGEEGRRKHRSGPVDGGRQRQYEREGDTEFETVVCGSSRGPALYEDVAGVSEQSWAEADFGGVWPGAYDEEGQGVDAQHRWSSEGTSFPVPTGEEIPYLPPSAQLPTVQTRSPFLDRVLQHEEPETIQAFTP